MQILIDADALVALAKSDDIHHARALEISSGLKHRRVDFGISPFAIPEAATVLSYKVSHDAAKKILEAARGSEFAELELTDEVRELADTWFLKLNQKGTSYFDCVNLALLQNYGFDAIFSFDKIYGKNGFRLAGQS